MSFIEKYIKYKKKYFNLKNQKGGNIVLPNSNIDYNDSRPPHEISMYKNMFEIYLGLAPKLLQPNLKLDDDRTNNDFSTITTSGPDKDYIINNDNNKFKINICGYEKEIILIRKDILFYKKSKEYECFTIGCTNKTYLLKLDNIIILFFPLGYVSSPLIITEEKHIENFINWLNNIKPFIEENKQLLLCGHSNGMSSAVKISFIFLFLANKIDLTKEIFQHIFCNNKKLFDQLELIKSQWTFLQNIDIYVTGTGGFPVLFYESNQFEEYYNLMSGKYLHIVSGFGNDYIELLYKENNYELYNDVLTTYELLKKEKNKIKNDSIKSIEIINLYEQTNSFIKDLTSNLDSKILLSNIFYKYLEGQLKNVKKFSKIINNDNLSDILEEEEEIDSPTFYKLNFQDIFCEETKTNVLNIINQIENSDVKNAFINIFNKKENLYEDRFVKKYIETENKDRLLILIDKNKKYLIKVEKTIDIINKIICKLKTLKISYNNKKDLFTEYKTIKISDYIHDYLNNWDYISLFVNNLYANLKEIKNNSEIEKKYKFININEKNNLYFIDNFIEKIVLNDLKYENYKFFVYDKIEKQAFCYRKCFFEKDLKIFNFNDKEYLHDFKNYRDILSGYFF
jgi:hypothetical protein